MPTTLRFTVSGLQGTDFMLEILSVSEFVLRVPFLLTVAYLFPENGGKLRLFLWFSGLSEFSVVYK